MNVNSLIISTLKPIIPEVKPVKYDGTSEEYITFNYADQRGDVYADDNPTQEIASLQIHLFTKKNYKPYEKSIRKALFNAGFTYPTITEQYESDTELYHITFECDYESDTDL